MKPITFLVSGSIGDVEPMITFAAALAGEGYLVRFACPAMFREQAEAARLEYHSALDDTDPRKIQLDDYEARKTRRFAFFTRYLRGGTPSQASLAAQVEAVRGSRLLICNTVIGNSCHIAESFNIPCIMTYYSPSFPTRHFPAPIGPQYSSFGPLYNQVTHRLVQRMFWNATRHWVNRWREQDLGLERVSLRALRQKQKGTLIRLFAFSKELLPHITDWPENNRISGFFWSRFSERDFQPDHALASFLEDGPPPVLVGFGSVRSPHVDATFRLLVQALTVAGRRAILVGGWGTDEMQNLGNRFFFSRFVPYRWLLPRVSLAIHAAGCGTIAEVARAGIPSIPIPFAGEQKFWAERLGRTGVALATVNARAIVPESMAQLIVKSIEDLQLRERVRNLQQKIREEDGVREGVRIVAEILGGYAITPVV